MWHDSFICVHTCDMTHSRICVTDSFMSATWLSQREWNMRGGAQQTALYAIVWHVSSVCVHMCDMSHSYVFIRVIKLIHLYVWCDALKCVTLLLQRPAEYAGGLTTYSLCTQLCDMSHALTKSFIRFFVRQVCIQIIWYLQNKKLGTTNYCSTLNFRTAGFRIDLWDSGDSAIPTSHSPLWDYRIFVWCP